MNDICPYCQTKQDKEVKRKIDCKKCGKTIYIRQGKVVTEREKEIFDWQKYMDFLVPDINEIRTTVEKKLTERFGKEPSSGDLVWGMFNYIVTRLREPRSLSILYDNMATFLESEGKQENAKQMRKQALKMTLEDFRNSPVTYKIGVNNTNDDFVCEECKKAHDLRMTLEEAIKNPPIPVETCKNKKCRCRLDYISEYESKDNHSQEIKIVVNVEKKQRGLLSKLFGTGK